MRLDAVTDRYKDMKDPCVVFDGTRYHIFGTGAKLAGQSWDVGHFTAPSIAGPWQEEAPSALLGAGGQCMVAPGVVFEDGQFHMFVQSTCFHLGGRVEYLVSRDGRMFTRVNTSLISQPPHEAGIYDPHPAVIERDGKVERYIVYTGMARVGHGDLYLARSVSGSWLGPWERLGRILRHEDVGHHNQHEDRDYEWGLEGAQLVQLPDGKVLLNAVCFLPGAPRGTKQRVFFATSDSPRGPFMSMGPVVPPSEDGWDCAENGHASALVQGNRLHLLYQARGHSTPWRYGRAVFDASTLCRVPDDLDEEQDDVREEEHAALHPA